MDNFDITAGKQGVDIIIPHPTTSLSFPPNLCVLTDDLSKVLERN